MEAWEVLIWGFLGGAFAELAGVFELRHRVPAELPDHLKSRFYWGVTLTMILAGAVLALAYSKSTPNLSAVLALNIGASAPLALRQIGAAVPSLTAGSSE